jgi:hypothetical protein
MELALVFSSNTTAELSVRSTMSRTESGELLKFDMLMPLIPLVVPAHYTIIFAEPVCASVTEGERKAWQLLLQKTAETQRVNCCV